MLTHKQGSTLQLESPRAPSRRVSSPSLPPRGTSTPTGSSFWASKLHQRQPRRVHDISTSTSTSTSASASASARFAPPQTRMPRVIQPSLHLPTQSLSVGHFASFGHGHSPAPITQSIRDSPWQVAAVVVEHVRSRQVQFSPSALPAVLSRWTCASETAVHKQRQRFPRICTGKLVPTSAHMYSSFSSQSVCGPKSPDQRTPAGAVPGPHHGPREKCFETARQLGAGWLTPPFPFSASTSTCVPPFGMFRFGFQLGRGSTSGSSTTGTPVASRPGYSVHQTEAQQPSPAIPGTEQFQHTTTRPVPNPTIQPTNQRPIPPSLPSPLIHPPIPS